jgi:hypothetical protein
MGTIKVCLEVFGQSITIRTYVLASLAELFDCDSLLPIFLRPQKTALLTLHV